MHVRLHVILGPTTSDPSAVRFLDILRRAMVIAGRQEAISTMRKSYHLHIHGFAEDFFSTWADRKSLF